MGREIVAQSTSNDDVAAAFTNWNLDTDRGYAFKTWDSILDSDSVTGENYIDKARRHAVNVTVPQSSRL